jgi:carbonic anhydrase
MTKNTIIRVGAVGVVLGAVVALGGCAGGEKTVSVDQYAALEAKVVELESSTATLVTEQAALSEALASPQAKPRPNVKTTFNEKIGRPKIGEGSYLDPGATVIGNVKIGDEVYVGPNATVRGDEGQPISIGNGTNIQDGVTMHALETTEEGEKIAKNLVTVDGAEYALYIGNNVSLAHGSMVHGPAAVGDNTFVGMMAFVFKSTIGKGVVIEPGALLIGVTVADGHYVPAGSVITSQAAADALPKITPDYAFATLNDGVLHVNHQLAQAYRGKKAEAAGAAEPEAAAATEPATTTAPEAAAAGATEAEAHGTTEEAHK